MSYAQSTVKGHIRAKQKIIIATTSKILISPFMSGDVWEKVNLNSTGRQKLGKWKSCQLDAACK